MIRKFAIEHDDLMIRVLCMMDPRLVIGFGYQVDNTHLHRILKFFPLDPTVVPEGFSPCREILNAHNFLLSEQKRIWPFS